MLHCCSNFVLEETKNGVWRGREVKCMIHSSPEDCQAWAELVNSDIPSTSTGNSKLVVRRRRRKAPRFQETQTRLPKVVEEEIESKNEEQEEVTIINTTQCDLSTEEQRRLCTLIFKLPSIFLKLLSQRRQIRRRNKKRFQKKSTKKSIECSDTDEEDFDDTATQITEFDFDREHYEFQKSLVNNYKNSSSICNFSNDKSTRTLSEEDIYERTKYRYIEI